MHLTSPLPGLNHLQNLTLQCKNFKRVLDFNLQVKGGLNNLIFSIGFQMLKIKFFQIALNTFGIVIQWY